MKMVVKEEGLRELGMEIVIKCNKNVQINCSPGTFQRLVADSSSPPTIRVTDCPLRTPINIKQASRLYAYRLHREICYRIRPS